MKTLLLTRHAQALPAEDGNDFNRKLSPKGLDDACALGAHLRRLSFIPDHILCSSAVRTSETCAKILDGLETDTKTEHLKSIYSAHKSELFNLIQNTANDTDTLMIVAHNPTIFELVVMLAAQGSDAALNHLSHGYAPASCSIIEAPVDDWAQINPNDCVLKAVFDPLEYNGAERPTRWM